MAFNGFFATLALVAVISVAVSVFNIEPVAAPAISRIILWGSLYWAIAIPPIVMVLVFRGKEIQAVKQLMLAATFYWVTLTLWQWGYSLMAAAEGVKEVGAGMMTGVLMASWLGTLTCDSILYAAVMVVLGVYWFATKPEKLE